MVSEIVTEHLIFTETEEVPETYTTECGACTSLDKWGPIRQADAFQGRSHGVPADDPEPLLKEIPCDTGMAHRGDEEYSPFGGFIEEGRPHDAMGGSTCNLPWIQEYTPEGMDAILDEGWQRVLDTEDPTIDISNLVDGFFK